RFGWTASPRLGSPAKRSSCARSMPCCPSCPSSWPSRHSPRKTGQPHQRSGDCDFRQKSRHRAVANQGYGVPRESRTVSLELLPQSEASTPMVIANTKARFGFALEYVSDIDAAKRFFVDVLGLELERDHPTFAQFKAG